MIERNFDVLFKDAHVDDNKQIGFLEFAAFVNPLPAGSGEDLLEANEHVSSLLVVGPLLLVAQRANVDRLLQYAVLLSMLNWHSRAIAQFGFMLSEYARRYSNICIILVFSYYNHCCLVRETCVGNPRFHSQVSFLNNSSRVNS
jgi:hypothetical protein